MMNRSERYKKKMKLSGNNCELWWKKISANDCFSWNTLNQLFVLVIWWYNGHRVFVYRCHSDCGVCISKMFFHCLHVSPTWHSEISSRYENITSSTSTGSAEMLFPGFAAIVAASLFPSLLTACRTGFWLLSFVNAFKYWRKFRGGCGSGRSPKNAFSMR